VTAVEVYQREATIARGQWGDERLALVVSTLMQVPDGAPPPTPAEVDLFAARCRATGMDPLANQIHAVFRRDRRSALGRSMTIQAGIDGIRAAALRTGEVTGSGPPEWLDGDGETWRAAWPHETPPLACRWTVKRNGHPYTATLNYREYVQTYDDRPQGRWVTAGADQLRKCTEAAALRMAFAETLGAIYEPAEVERLDAIVPDDVRAERAAEAADRAGDLRIADADVEAIVALARAAKLTRGEIRGILEDVAGVGRGDHVRRRDLAAVLAALQARLPNDSAPPQGAPNVGTPEVIPADDDAGDGEIVEPDVAEAGDETDGEPDREAEPASTGRGDPPPEPAPKRRRERKPKPADAPVAAAPPPDDTPADADPLADAFQPPLPTADPAEPLDDEPPGFGANPHPAGYGPGAP
jgi:phage recombination protein Bet